MQIPGNMLNKKKNTETIFLIAEIFKEFIVSILFTDLKDLKNLNSDAVAFFSYHVNLKLESEQ